MKLTDAFSKKKRMGRKLLEISMEHFSLSADDDSPEAQYKFKCRKKMSELIEAGADLTITDDRGRTALMHLVMKNPELFPDQIFAIVNSGRAEINAQDDQGNNAIIYAADRGAHEMIHFLAVKGGDMDLKNKKDRSALTVMMDNNGWYSLQFVLNFCKDIDAPDPKTGKTPLMRAAERNECTITGMLAKRGAHFDTRCNEGLTTAQWAIMGRITMALKNIHEAGADINELDGDGRSLLHFAVLTGNNYAIDYLLEQGHDPHLKDKKGVTPYDLILDYTVWDDADGIDIDYMKRRAAEWFHNSQQEKDIRRKKDVGDYCGKGLPVGPAPEKDTDTGQITVQGRRRNIHPFVFK